MDLKKTKTSFKLSNRQDLILDKLKIFYTKSIMDILLPIINAVRWYQWRAAAKQSLWRWR